MFLAPSPPPKAVPDAGQFRLPLTPFSLRFLPYLLRAAQAPQQPGCSDVHRTADSSIKEFYTGDGLQRNRRFDCVCLCLTWPSSPSVVDDVPTNSGSSG